MGSLRRRGSIQGLYKDHKGVVQGYVPRTEKKASAKALSRNSPPVMALNLRSHQTNWVLDSVSPRSKSKPLKPTQHSGQPQCRTRAGSLSEVLHARISRQDSKVPGSVTGLLDPSVPLPALVLQAQGYSEDAKYEGNGPPQRQTGQQLAQAQRLPTRKARAATR